MGQLGDARGTFENPVFLGMNISKGMMIEFKLSPTLRTVTQSEWRERAATVASAQPVFLSEKAVAPSNRHLTESLQASVIGFSTHSSAVAFTAVTRESIATELAGLRVYPTINPIPRQAR